MNIPITCSFLYVRITDLSENQSDFRTLCFRRRPPFVRTAIMTSSPSVRTVCAHLSKVFIPLSSDIQLHVNMEHIGTLSNKNQALSHVIIPIFGILCPSASKDEECYFCMEKINQRSIPGNEITMLRTPRSYGML